MLALLALSFLGCSPEADDRVSKPTEVGVTKVDDTAIASTGPFAELDADETWLLPNLDGDAWVVRTTGSIPYAYAENRVDLARISGFALARDRFVMIDLVRRSGAGTLSGLLGQDALEIDVEARTMGMTRVAQQFTAVTDEDPELAAILDGYVEGINAYVDAVKRGELPVPSEFDFLGPLIGAEDPTELLQPFTRDDMGFMGATIIYNLGFETTDVGRATSAALLDSTFLGAPEEALRTDGLRYDVWENAAPVHDTCSAPGWGTVRRAAPPQAQGTPRRPAVPAKVLDALHTRMQRFEARMGHDRESGYGSNAWAVAGSATTDGRSLLAGDGHLPLSVPSLFYSLGMDTAVLGGGDTTQVGLVLPGLPTMAVGTNGKVAWSQTQLFGDITDWYAEEVVLDADGAPASTVFQGGEQAVVAISEDYEIASVPLLGSIGRTESWTRYTTFDGRMITAIEGRDASPDEALAAGETLVLLGGDYIVPGDIDGDGIISGISVDHTAFDDGNILKASDSFGHAASVTEFQEETKRLVGYSQSILVADAGGSVLFTGYQAVPLRGYLPRNADGTWIDGADPRGLIDGTQYQGFTVPVGPDGKVDETRTDPYEQLVPFEAYPQVIDPPEGYVLNANNDIGCISTDGSLLDDPFYLGGPWLEGFRAERIDELLDDAVTNGTADLAAMSRIQGDHESTVAAHFLPTFLDAMDGVLAAASGTHEPGSTGARQRDRYQANKARIDEALVRLEAWHDAGQPARSGVETFYSPIENGDLDHSVATSLWHAWMSAAIDRILSDEGFPGVYYPTGDTGRTRTLTAMFDGRGPGNALDLASWNPETEESIFFDIKDTPEIETSGEVLLIALEKALDDLEAPETDPGYGGYGTDDMSQYLWGLRHMAKFESLLAEAFGSDPTFAFLVEPFNITTDLLPLAASIPSDDPRDDLPWFPRHGDMLNVDAANAGFGTGDHTYGSGPVFRMVIALGPDGAEGVNMIPGGQSGLNDSDHFADQAALWLANETWPMHTDVDDVLADAIRIEHFPKSGF